MLRLAGLLVALLVWSALCLSAANRCSASFDEITFPCSGARGLATGRFDLQPEHPPLFQYLFGAPLILAGTRLPPEAGQWSAANRYAYAQTLLFYSGNDPEAVMRYARLVSIVCGAILIAATFLFVRSAVHESAAVWAAGLVAFLPDVIGHAGVAYTDLPAAMFTVLFVWALHTSWQQPGPRSGAVLGLTLGLCIGTKFSLLALTPLILSRQPRTIVPCLAALYATLVVIYRGDFVLEEMRYGLQFVRSQVGQGIGQPWYLLGERGNGGVWYYFPVLFFLKTPVALHIMLVAAAILLIRKQASLPPRFIRCMAPILAIMTLGLLTARLNIGSRHALPFLVLLVIAVGTILSYARPSLQRALYIGSGAYVLSTLFAWPWFISYTSEVVPRNRPWVAVADSNLDWGQGLLELRRYMQEHNLEKVGLAYFGTAHPRGYGVQYEPLPSFFSLGPTTSTPDVIVISATLMTGLYLDGDPYASFRTRTPDTVLARSLLVFRRAGPAPPTSSYYASGLARIADPSAAPSVPPPPGGGRRRWGR